jgi:hypothetical protein
MRLHINFCSSDRHGWLAPAKIKPRTIPALMESYRNWDGKVPTQEPRQLSNARAIGGASRCLFAQVRSVIACAFRFLRHHASRPPLAKIRPGSPLPTMGPGTVAREPVTDVS